MLFLSGSCCPRISHTTSVERFVAARFLLEFCYFLHNVSSKYSTRQKIFFIAHSLQQPQSLVAKACLTLLRPVFLEDKLLCHDSFLKYFSLG